MLQAGRQRFRLRHYAASRKAAVAIPHEVVEAFNLPHPSSSTVALGFTERLTNKYQEPLRRLRAAEA
jgi:hypothetical protein